MFQSKRKVKYHTFENRWCGCDYVLIIVPQGLSKDDLLEHLKKTQTLIEMPVSWLKPHVNNCFL